MKKPVSILILCLLFFIACANTNQIPKSLSSSYDGVWDGFAQTHEERVYIKVEIKNGIVSGFFEDKELNGYVNSDNNLIINPFSFCIKHPATPKCGAPVNIICETNFMSPSRIEGTYHIAKVAQAHKYDWFVVKPATGKSDNTISNVKSDTTFSNVKVNEKEPWTGKWKVESAYELNGVWAMKQEGQIVKSTIDSNIEFKGKIQENQLKGKVNYSGTYLPFIIEIPSDGMSFKGSLDYFGGRQYILKGKRIG